MAAQSWSSDRAPSMGAALAYYTVFSLAPMLVLVVAVAGLAFGRQAAEGALFGELAGVIGVDSAKIVEDTLASASSTKSGIIASVVGFFTLIFAATAVFGELQSSLNVIWKAKAPEGFGAWNYVRSRLLSLSLVLTIGFLLLVSLALSAALTAFADLLDRTLPGLPVILRLLHLTLSLGFLTLFFAMMFKILPDTDIEWRDVWSGAAATAILFTLGKYLIGLYIGSSAVASAYGAASALVILLVWVYYSAQILLFGAEFAKARFDHRLSLQGGPKGG
ncbi:MAG TPA: YihY/virulence factor BrkB family protein [Aliidongia sp.]|nr:YihY/virulence factor BrkB family protein [Aliidongia sp.]